ncbi:MAG: NAD(P)-binding protein, partial [Vicinamibacteria bacterium]
MGAGVGGLVAGAVLSRAGGRLLVIEKGSLVGGGVKVVADGEWHVPVGPHGFPSDSLERAFDRARVRAPLYETGKYALYNRVTKKTYSFLESADEPPEIKAEKYNLGRADGDAIATILE